MHVLLHMCMYIYIYIYTHVLLYMCIITHVYVCIYIKMYTGINHFHDDFRKKTAVNKALRGHRLGQVRLVSQLVQSMVGGLTSLGELHSQVLSASQALFGTFPPYGAHVPSFHVFLLCSHYSCVCLFLLHPRCSMREVSCVRCTPRLYRSVYNSC